MAKRYPGRRMSQSPPVQALKELAFRLQKHADNLMEFLVATGRIPDDQDGPQEADIHQEQDTGALSPPAQPIC